MSIANAFSSASNNRKSSLSINNLKTAANNYNEISNNNSIYNNSKDDKCTIDQSKLIPSSSSPSALISQQKYFSSNLLGTAAATTTTGNLFQGNNTSKNSNNITNENGLVSPASSNTFQSSLLQGYNTDAHSSEVKKFRSTATKNNSYQNQCAQTLQQQQHKLKDYSQQVGVVVRPTNTEISSSREGFSILQKHAGKSNDNFAEEKVNSKNSVNNSRNGQTGAGEEDGQGSYNSSKNNSVQLSDILATRFQQNISQMSQLRNELQSAENHSNNNSNTNKGMSKNNGIGTIQSGNSKHLVILGTEMPTSLNGSSFILHKSSDSKHLIEHIEKDSCTTTSNLESPYVLSSNNTSSHDQVGQVIQNSSSFKSSASNFSSNPFQKEQQKQSFDQPQTQQLQYARIATSKAKCRDSSSSQNTCLQNKSTNGLSSATSFKTIQGSIPPLPSNAVSAKSKSAYQPVADVMGSRNHNPIQYQYNEDPKSSPRTESPIGSSQFHNKTKNTALLEREHAHLIASRQENGINNLQENSNQSHNVQPGSIISLFHESHELGLRKADKDPEFSSRNPIAFGTPKHSKHQASQSLERFGMKIESQMERQDINADAVSTLKVTASSPSQQLMPLKKQQSYNSSDTVKHTDKNILQSQYYGINNNNNAPNSLVGHVISCSSALKQGSPDNLLPKSKPANKSNLPGKHKIGCISDFRKAGEISGLSSSPLTPSSAANARDTPHNRNVGSPKCNSNNSAVLAGSSSQPFYPNGLINQKSDVLRRNSQSSGTDNSHSITYTNSSSLPLTPQPQVGSVMLGSQNKPTPSNNISSNNLSEKSNSQQYHHFPLARTYQKEGFRDQRIDRQLAERSIADRRTFSRESFSEEFKLSQQSYQNLVSSSNADVHVSTPASIKGLSLLHDQQHQDDSQSPQQSQPLPFTKIAQQRQHFSSHSPGILTQGFSHHPMSLQTTPQQKQALSSVSQGIQQLGRWTEGPQDALQKHPIYFLQEDKVNLSRGQKGNEFAEGQNQQNDIISSKTNPELIGLSKQSNQKKPSKDVARISTNHDHVNREGGSEEFYPIYPPRSSKLDYIEQLMPTDRNEEEDVTEELAELSQNQNKKNLSNETNNHKALHRQQEGLDNSKQISRFPENIHLNSKIDAQIIKAGHSNQSDGINDSKENIKQESTNFEDNFKQISEFKCIGESDQFSGASYDDKQHYFQSLLSQLLQREKLFNASHSLDSSAQNLGRNHKEQDNKSKITEITEYKEIIKRMEKILSSYKSQLTFSQKRAQENEHLRGLNEDLKRQLEEQKLTFAAQMKEQYSEFECEKNELKRQIVVLKEELEKQQTQRVEVKSSFEGQAEGACSMGFSTTAFLSSDKRDTLQNNRTFNTQNKMKKNSSNLQENSVSSSASGCARDDHEMSAQFACGAQLEDSLEELKRKYQVKKSNKKNNQIIKKQQYLKPSAIIKEQEGKSQTTTKESKELQALNNSFELLADIARNSCKKQDKTTTTTKIGNCVVLNNQLKQQQASNKDDRYDTLQQESIEGQKQSFQIHDFNPSQLEKHQREELRSLQEQIENTAKQLERSFGSSPQPQSFSEIPNDRQTDQLNQFGEKQSEEKNQIIAASQEQTSELSNEEINNSCGNFANMLVGDSFTAKIASSSSCQESPRYMPEKSQGKEEEDQEQLNQSISGGWGNNSQEEGIVSFSEQNCKDNHDIKENEDKDNANCSQNEDPSAGAMIVSEQNISFANQSFG